MIKFAEAQEESTEGHQRLNNMKKIDAPSTIYFFCITKVA